MGSYIDFIETMPTDRAIAREFKKMIRSYSAEELSLWFEIKGYEVSMEECRVIIKNNRTNLFLMEEAIPYLFLNQ
jgi:hypothetical protein